MLLARLLTPLLMKLLTCAPMQLFKIVKFAIDCKFDRSKFRKLLAFAVRGNHSMFDGKLYDQTDGVAMGSPLGPSLANIFMSFLENRYLNNCAS